MMKGSNIRMFDRLIGSIITLAGCLTLVMAHRWLVNAISRAKSQRKKENRDDENSSQQHKRNNGTPNKMPTTDADELHRLRYAKSNTALFNGACHCQRVRFRVRAPRHLQAVDVPSKIRFPRVTIPCVHTFCSFCGVHILYSPSLDPAEIQINADCMVAAANEDRVSISYSYITQLETSCCPVTLEKARAYNKRGTGAGSVPSMESLAHMQHLIDLHNRSVAAREATSASPIRSTSPLSGYESPSSSKGSSARSHISPSKSENRGIQDEGMGSWATTFSLGNMSPLRLPLISDDSYMQFTEESRGLDIGVRSGKRRESLGDEEGLDLFESIARMSPTSFDTGNSRNEEATSWPHSFTRLSSSAEYPSSGAYSNLSYDTSVYSEAFDRLLASPTKVRPFGGYNRQKNMNGGAKMNSMAVPLNTNTPMHRRLKQHLRHYLQDDASNQVPNSIDE